MCTLVPPPEASLRLTDQKSLMRRITESDRKLFRSRCRRPTYNLHHTPLRHAASAMHSIWKPQSWAVPLRAIWLAVWTYTAHSTRGILLPRPSMQNRGLALVLSEEGLCGRKLPPIQLQKARSTIGWNETVAAATVSASILALSSHVSFTIRK